MKVHQFALRITVQLILGIRASVIFLSLFVYDALGSWLRDDLSLDNVYE